MPIAVVVLLLLFVSQRFGTEKVGACVRADHGGVVLALAALGLLNISHNPEVLQALNPWWAVHFFATHGWHGIFILGAVVLAVTGGEALYADMGHFGARPIRYAGTSSCCRR